MADPQIAPSFGAELKDAFKPVNAWVSHGIAWLDDIQSFYRERSAIEKEYSQKLATLAKKYYEKKAKKTGTLSVGDSPVMTPGSLESASLTTWTTQLTTLESHAAEHDQFGNHLVSQVAEPMRVLALRYEDIRKRQALYAENLEKERDKTYSELKKTKGKYDEACQEVENKRKKAESSFDFAKDKAQRAYVQQIAEMNNVKNTYLIAVKATNRQKEMYYHEYVPDVLDALQDLNESRTNKLNYFWMTATNLELGMLKKSTDYCNYLAIEIPRNVPQLDTMMFVRHNAAAWNEPPDKVFEPSPVWHDDDKMIIDEPAQIFLRNILNKSKSQLGDLRRQVDMKRKEVEGLKRLQQNVRNGVDSKDEVLVWNQLLSTSEQLHEIEHQRLNAETETQTITKEIGDLTIGARSHNFKGQTFKIPTNCDLCGERIWGLNAKGFDCRDCGYTCHSKCEMKVPAECPGETSKEDRKKLKAERQAKANANSGRKASNATSLATQKSNGSGSVVTPTTTSSKDAGLSRSNTMTSLSSGYGNRAGALSRQRTSESYADSIAEVDGEQQVSAIKPSGSGTVKARRQLAPPPTNYMSELPGSGPVSELSAGSANGEIRGKMVYSYDGNGAGEISVREGSEVVVLEPDDGSGWVRVRSGYKEGLVPGSYLEILSASSYTPPPPNHNRPASSYSTAGSVSSIANSTTGKKQGPAVAPRRGAKKVKYVEALYPYEAQTDQEWNMSEGERFVLVRGDQGDGWAEVERGGITKSVPANYVSLLQ